MNNSLTIDLLEQAPSVDTGPILRERDSKLVRIIEAIDGILATPQWRTLKELVFDEVLESTESKIRVESNKPEISTANIYRLQGEKLWAQRYASLEKLRDKFHKELLGIRKITPGG